MKYLAHFSDVFRGGGVNKYFLINAVDDLDAQRKLMRVRNVKPSDLEVRSYADAWDILTSGEDLWEVTPINIDSDVTEIVSEEY